MKRSMIFVAVVLLFVAAPAFGQTQTQPSVYVLAEGVPDATPYVIPHGNPFSDENYTIRAAGVTAEKVIANFVAGAYGYPIEWQSVPRQPLSVNIINQPRAVVMDTILRAVGHRYTVDDANSMVIVHRENQIQQEHEEESFRARRDAPYERELPVAYHPDGTVGSLREVNRLTRQAFYAGPSRFDYGPRGSHYAPTFMFAYPGCLSGPSGYIKFKYLGRRDQRHLWYVKINGEVIGTIDQGDSFWNKVPVCANSTLVTIEKMGTGSWSERYSIRPWTLTEIGVGDFLPLR